MGSHYGSVHVRAATAKQVKAALETVAAATGQRFFVSPPRDNWVTAYPSEAGQDFAVSEKVAQLLDGEDVLHLLVHDDDIFAYRFYRGGLALDEYSSDPDYFGDVPAEEHARPAGQADVFSGLLRDVPETLGAVLRRYRTHSSPSLEAILRTGRSEATRRMVQMATLLGLSGTETSYEYLLSGNARDRRGLVHVPDRSSEVSARKRAAQALRAYRARLAREGVLLFSRVGEGRGPLAAFPQICAHHHSGFFLAWAEHGVPRDARPLQLLSAPWETTEDVGIALDPTVHGLALSPSGRLLAVGHASGSWIVEVWSLDDGVRKARLAAKRAVEALAFTSDEAHILTLSDGRVEVRDVATGAVGAAFEGARQALAAHPQEGTIVHGEGDGHEMRIGIRGMDGAPLRSLRTRANDFATWQEAVARGAAETGFSPHEAPRVLAFTPDGRHLLLVVNEGLRVYAWDEVKSANGALPAPISVGETALVRREGRFRSAHRFTYDVAFDPARNLALFCGLDGAVRALDIASGEARVLLEIPGRPAVWKMALASDRTALATVSQLMDDEGGRRRTPPVFDVWDYPRLLGEQVPAPS